MAEPEVIEIKEGVPRGLGEMQSVYVNEQFCEPEGKFINCQSDCFECWMEGTGRNRRNR